MTGVVTKLFESQTHVCMLFTGLVTNEAIPSNQFVIVNNHKAALFDPGGDLTFTALNIELSKYINIENLDLVFASHQDPDIISSLPRWLMHTQCEVVTSRLWTRFLPHLISGFVSDKMQSTLQNRILEIPDDGLTVPLGDSYILAVPAHFLHSVGNFHFYDPISKILFSGDVGAANTPGKDHVPVENIDLQIPLMEGFHRRYMASNRACRAWVKIVRSLDVEMMIPQHGQPFIGKAIVNQFLDWFETLSCGSDFLEV